jgi:hypothetical protein
MKVQEIRAGRNYVDAEGQVYRVLQIIPAQSAEAADLVIVRFPDGKAHAGYLANFAECAMSEVPESVQ